MIYLLVAILVILIIQAIQLGRLQQLILDLTSLNGSKVSNEYKETAQIQKIKKSPMQAVKEKLRGRSIVKSDDFVDIADLDFDTAYKAIEDIGNGPTR